MTLEAVAKIKNTLSEYWAIDNCPEDIAEVFKILASLE